ncbi:membrane protein [sediment metagenome]|uniref:Membrane protein n=1 Tax=sediment metagenome TaxID=749907 RepID=D9PJS7_9ZZZZ
MNIMKLVGYTIGLVWTCGIALLIHKSMPGASGAFFGMSVYLVLHGLSDTLFGGVKVEKLIPQSIAASMGLIPTIMALLSFVSMVWGFVADIFILSFAGSLAVMISLLLVYIQGVAKNSIPR